MDDRGNQDLPGRHGHRDRVGRGRPVEPLQSVVSKRIADLEAALGAPPFQRHAGRITPTGSAEELALRLRPALTEMTPCGRKRRMGNGGAARLRAYALGMPVGVVYHSCIGNGSASGLLSLRGAVASGCACAPAPDARGSAMRFEPGEGGTCAV